MSERDWLQRCLPLFLAIRPNPGFPVAMSLRIVSEAEIRLFHSSGTGTEAGASPRRAGLRWEGPGMPDLATGRKYCRGVARFSGCEFVRDGCHASHPATRITRSAQARHPGVRREAHRICMPQHQANRLMGYGSSGGITMCPSRFRCFGLACTTASLSCDLRWL